MLIDVLDTKEVVLYLKETTPQAIIAYLETLKTKGEGGCTVIEITSHLVNHHNPEKFGADGEAWEGYSVEQILTYLRIMLSRDEVILDQDKKWRIA